jgi:glycerophosphoryl diester phosphodiesterase
MTPPLPQVVAHRGASFENAEHTLGAYVKALDAGAEGLECDVRLTADGHLVCVHDRDLRRTASRRGLISTSNLEDLEALDFAAWKSPWAELDDEAPDRDKSLDSVLTLRKLLEMVADYDRRVEVAIETKHPTRYGGLVERRVAAMLHDFGWDGPSLPEPNPVRVMSFSNTALHRMHRLTPHVQLVQLVDKAAYWPVVRRMMHKDWLVGPGIELLQAHPRLAEQIVASGHPVHVWTVNTERDLRRCQELGVRAVITDRPAYVLELLGK